MDLDCIVDLLDLEIIKPEEMSYQALSQISNFLDRRRDKYREILTLVDDEIYDRHLAAAEKRIMNKEMRHEVK